MSNRFQMPSTDAVDLTGRTILQVVPELETGGAEITTMEMAEAIVQAGGRALVASEGGALESRIEAAGGEIVCAGRVKNRSPSGAMSTIGQARCKMKLI